METIITIAGYAAAICMILGYVPQAWYTIRTRDTDGIALSTFMLMGAGSIFFIIQGALMHNVPLVLTNTITAISSCIIFGIKMYNDHFKHKGAKSSKLQSAGQGR